MSEDTRDETQFVARSLEEVGVRAFELPDEGFDPKRASNAELARHGYPTRPDREQEPSLHAQWEWVMWRATARVVPEFGAVPVVDGEVLYPGWPPGSSVVTSGNWSGGVVVVDRNIDAVTSITGMWTVPHVLYPQVGDSPSCCSTWVGFDGWIDQEVSSLLQAGTAQWVYPPFDLHLTFAWWEWVPEDPVAITSVPVVGGDLVYCQIKAPSPSEASFYLQNVTTGVNTAFTKPAPSEPPLLAVTGEWILEAPIDKKTNQPVPCAQYGSVYFDNCHAETRSGRTLYSKDAELIEMTDDYGYAISKPTLLNDTAFRLDYLGAQEYE
jgi:hypothetical protein